MEFRPETVTGSPILYLPESAGTVIIFSALPAMLQDFFPAQPSQPVSSVIRTSTLSG